MQLDNLGIWETMIVVLLVLIPVSIAVGVWVIVKTAKRIEGSVLDLMGNEATKTTSISGDLRAIRKNIDEYFDKTVTEAADNGVGYEFGYRNAYGAGPKADPGASYGVGYGNAYGAGPGSVYRVGSVAAYETGDSVKGKSPANEKVKVKDRYQSSFDRTHTDEQDGSNAYKMYKEGYGANEPALADEKKEADLCEESDPEEPVRPVCCVKKVQYPIPGAKVKYIITSKGDLEVYTDNTIRINESCFERWNNYAFYNKSGIASAYEFIYKNGGVCDTSLDYNGQRIKLIKVDKNAKARSDGEAYIVTEKGKVFVEIEEG